MRFPPSSHTRGASVRRSAIRNLYSKAQSARSVTLHSGKRLSSIGTARRQPPSSSPLPTTASTSSGSSAGQTQRSVTFPSAAAHSAPVLRPSMPRVKASDRSGQSSGMSFHRSSTVSVPSANPSGSRSRWGSRSPRRRAPPSDTTS